MAPQFGVWPGRRFLGVSGRDLECAGCALYGPRTTLYISFKEWAYSAEFTLVGSGTSRSWEMTLKRDAFTEGKLFAPANLRAAQDLPGYAALLDGYMSSRYTLRYTGGMVPDVTQLIVKGYGVFASPESQAAPAKLRLLYEALPMAFVIERAGGASSDGSASLLDRKVLTFDERTPVCLGSGAEVKKFETACPREHNHEAAAGDAQA